MTKTKEYLELRNKVRMRMQQDLITITGVLECFDKAYVMGEKSSKTINREEFVNVLSEQIWWDNDGCIEEDEFEIAVDTIISTLEENTYD